MIRILRRRCSSTSLDRGVGSPGPNCPWPRPSGRLPPLACIFRLNLPHHCSHTLAMAPFTVSSAIIIASRARTAEMVSAYISVKSSQSRDVSALHGRWVRVIRALVEQVQAPLGRTHMSRLARLLDAFFFYLCFGAVSAYLLPFVLCTAFKLQRQPLAYLWCVSALHVP